MRTRNTFLLSICLMGLVLSGCAGRTPDARWAQQRQALTSLNDVFSEQVDAGKLTDRQTVDIGTVLQMGTAYLDAAKGELPEGGSTFESLLLKTQRVLDLIRAQLAAREQRQ